MIKKHELGFFYNYTKLEEDEDRVYKYWFLNGYIVALKVVK